ncbi:MBL fold metallo-hydrolase [uncultured Sphingomonas sp.]|uniref:MBL fold metallo-hydrolase n=1 Tax=uncultured Sphingomonas sp. TaxID=158754 RepID=UPI0026215190|nr:MBL fold metallo-hydrolase [uncultured Sphingomonas sp.]
MLPKVTMTRRGILGSAIAGMATSALPLRAAAPPTDRWVLLGTGGGPIPRKTRAQPANLLQIGDRSYLIDLGAGVTHQLTLAGVNLSKIDVAFISHLHLDHSAGLASFIALDWVEAAMRRLRSTPVPIYGPPGTQQVVEDTLKAISIQANIFRAESAQATPPEQWFSGRDIKQSGPLEVYRDEVLRVTAVENTHYSTMKLPEHSYGRDMSFSYRFETPWRSIVYTGDTGPSPAVEKLAMGADVLISEVIDLQGVIGDIRRKAAGKNIDDTPMIRHMEMEHLTPENVGAMAARTEVKKLVLTHIGLPPNAETADEKYMLSEIRKNYAGPVIFGSDLMSI